MNWFQSQKFEAGGVYIEWCDLVMADKHNNLFQCGCMVLCFGLLYGCCLRLFFEELSNMCACLRFALWVMLSSHEGNEGQHCGVGDTEGRILRFEM